ncbi:MAG: hypothetical protein MMC33_007470 [Icmadophila ericetorum]|nr:hypothetical protein [Icmadophila ericetorum]
MDQESTTTTPDSIEMIEPGEQHDVVAEFIPYNIAGIGFQTVTFNESGLTKAEYARRYVETLRRAFADMLELPLAAIADSDAWLANADEVGISAIVEDQDDGTVVGRGRPPRR